MKERRTRPMTLGVSEPWRYRAHQREVSHLVSEGTLGGVSRGFDVCIYVVSYPMKDD